MEPIVNGLEQEFIGQLQVMRLDANDPVNAQHMQDMGRQCPPFFAIIDAQGNITVRFFGLQTAETLREAMRCRWSLNERVL